MRIKESSRIITIFIVILSCIGSLSEQVKIVVA